MRVIILIDFFYFHVNHTKCPALIGDTKFTVAVVKHSIALNFITQLHIIFCSSVLNKVFCSVSQTRQRKSVIKKKVFNNHHTKRFQHKDVLIGRTAKRQQKMISLIVVPVHAEVWRQRFPPLSNKLTLHWSLSLCLHRDNTRWSCCQKIPGHISSVTASLWRTQIFWIKKQYNQLHHYSIVQQNKECLEFESKSC